MPEDSTASPDEVRTEIRFALSQMGSRDAHHEFEHLARDLARNTVTRNLLPATGPVSTSGDQGRDGETYESDLPAQVEALGRELGVADGDGVALACTLQQSSPLAKFKADIKKIVDEGSSVKWVVAYCEKNVPVGERHTFQAEMLKAHGLHVEVFDGNGIAELLAQRHLYWIARSHLNLPERDLPSPVDPPAWYAMELHRWQPTSDASVATAGDAIEIKSCMRFATESQDARRDLPYWLDLAESILATASLPEVHQMGLRYDIARASLRGLGTLRPAEHHVRTFVEWAARSGESSSLRDAGVLVVYACGATRRGHSDLGPELPQWTARLLTRAEELLAESTGPGNTCALLDAQAFLQLGPDPTDAVTSVDDTEIDPDADFPFWSPQEWEAAIRDGIATRAAVGIIDQDGGLSTMLQLAELLPEAPLFPVRHLSELLSIHAPALADDPRFEQITNLVDARLAAVEGDAAAAAAARDRALSFFKDGRYLLALRELHKARLGWFSGDYGRRLVLVCLMTAECYVRLDLRHAAKYAALVSIHLVRERDSDLVPRALFAAGLADYESGAWYSAAQGLQLAVNAHDSVVSDPDNVEKHPALVQGMAALTTMSGAALHLGEPFKTFLDLTLERAGLADLYSQITAENESSFWTTATYSEAIQHAASELGCAIPSDAGEARSIAWSALGVTWVLKFQNDYETTTVAERVAAQMQIVLADLAPRDPVLVPTRVTIELSTSDPGSEFQMSTPVGTGHASIIEVTIPRMGPATQESLDATSSSSLALAMGAIAEVSALAGDGAFALMMAALEDGLKGRMLFGTAYDQLYETVMPRAVFDEAPRRSTESVPAGLEPSPPCSPELKMPATAPVFFDVGGYEAAIGRRYDRIGALLPVTFPALVADPGFQAAVSELRADGWSDWQILHQVFNVAQNLRFPVGEPPKTEAEAKALTQAFMEAEAPEADPLPAAEFTAATLRETWPMAVITWLQAVAHLPHQNPPDVDAIEHLLRARFLLSHDIEHEDPFTS